MFSPLQVSPYAWWDAEVAASLTLSGASVTTWTDIVGGYAPTQSNAGFKPQWSATSFNNRPGITFDGTDDYLELASVPFPVDANPCEIWVLVSQSALAADTASRTIFAYGSSASTGTRRTSRSVTTGVNRALTFSGSGGGTSSAENGSIDFSGIHVVRTIVTATTIETNVDGTGMTPVGVVSATGATRTRIGATTTNTVSGFFQGVANTILVTPPLGTGQAAALMAYLKARGGIA